MKRLEERVALITGAASGIGAACALRFAQEGARLVGFDLQHPDAAEGDWARAVKAAPDLACLSCLVDTNGACDLAVWDELAPVMDGAMVDLKCLDPMIHEQMTGQSNDQVLAGIRHLCTLDRLYDSADFRGARFGPARWLDGGTFYTTLEPSEAVSGGRDIVRYESESGVRTITVSASLLMPNGVPSSLMPRANQSPSHRCSCAAAENSSAAVVISAAMSSCPAARLVFDHSRSAWTVAIVSQPDTPRPL